MSIPRVIIFASGQHDRIADGVRENLRRDHAGQRFEVDVWKDGYFNETMTQPLNTFLKRLLCFDIAVLILGADDLRQPASGSSPLEYVPRDNVVFELGAAMARMGTRKTFVMTPAGRKVALPSYFDGLNLLTYDERIDDNTVAGTGAACASMRDVLRRLDGDVYHSDLPAIGLAQGYFYNFVNAVYSTLAGPQDLAFKSGLRHWDPDDGFRLVIVIPNKMLNREEADRELRLVGAENIHLRLRDGRDVSVYALIPAAASGPLTILDIPTTLLTSEDVIERVDQFWGAGDIAFKNDLGRREREAFERRLRELREKARIVPERAPIIWFDALQAHLP